MSDHRGTISRAAIDISFHLASDWSTTRRQNIPLLAICFSLTLSISIVWGSGRGLAQKISERPTPMATHSFLRGMALGQIYHLDEVLLDRSLQEIRDLGTSHVSLIVTWSTPDIYSTTIAPRLKKTTPDHVLIRLIQRAHEFGLRVFLFPILDVQARKINEWRGTLKPSDWNAWWRSYRKFILHYAELTAEHRVDLLCVGSELVSTEKQREYWENLIRRVRTIYPGRIAYSANWDHYAPVSFWDLVDVIGLTAYYRLAPRSGAAETVMHSSWRKIKEKLVSWSTKTGRPFIFTEVGYPSLVGGAVSPWDYTKDTPPSAEEQRRAYSAFIQTWKEVSHLGGVVFWNWYGEGGPRDKSYTPRGKPAAQLIRAYFSEYGDR